MVMDRSGRSVIDSLTWVYEKTSLSFFEYMLPCFILLLLLAKLYQHFEERVPIQPEPVPTISSRSEEHTSELQSRGLNSYAVFCLKQKNDIDRAYTSEGH